MSTQGGPQASHQADQDDMNDLTNSLNLQFSTLDPLQVSMAEITGLSASTLTQILQARTEASRRGSKMHTTSRKTFACPFYRKHPERHQGCLRSASDIQDSIPRLIDHLWDAHLQPPYCPSCHATFTDSATCNEHIRRRTCVVRPDRMVKDLTEYQVGQLSGLDEMYEEYHLALAPEVQWLIVWNIAFRGQAPPPQGVYLSSPFEVLVCAVRDFWQQNGPAILSSFLRARPGPGSESFERTPAALHRDVLDRMIAELLAAYTGNESGLAQGSSEAARSLIFLFGAAGSGN